MSMQSSSNQIGIHFPNPDKSLQFRPMEVSESENLFLNHIHGEDKNVENVQMADQLRPMEELLQIPIIGIEDAIVVPAVLAKEFELKIELLDFIRGSPTGIHGLFSGWYCGLASRKVTLRVSMAWAKVVTTGTLVRYKTSRGRLLGNHFEDVEAVGFLYTLTQLLSLEIERGGSDGKRELDGWEVLDAGWKSLSIAEGSTDIAKISRKRSKPGNHGHGKGKENTRAGRMLSKGDINEHKPSHWQYQKGMSNGHAGQRRKHTYQEGFALKVWKRSTKASDTGFPCLAFVSLDQNLIQRWRESIQ
ncbi:hypothetical protein Tco_0162433 [Tanacetum coccineum]